MNAARHKKTVFKGILVLIGLALFIVQLSDRFYLFANKPFNGITGKDGSCKSSHISKPGLSGICCFSPDKRYHSENGFALLTPLFEQRHMPALQNPEFYTVDENSVWSVFPVTALRGPPAS